MDTNLIDKDDKKKIFDPLIVKPLVRWLGSKNLIINFIIDKFPTEINNYYEIFVGGGSVLFTFLSYVKKGIIKLNHKVYAYDITEGLIYFYKNIQTNPNEVYDQTMEYVNKYKSYKNDNLITSKENYYYTIRQKYVNLPNKKSINASAMFLFLNKTCFKGVYREGLHGYNSPFGFCDDIELNKNHLLNISELIKDVTFECLNFKKSIDNPNPFDFVYLDPPYVPNKVTALNGFTRYNFKGEDHKKLFDKIHNLTNNNVKILLSNSNSNLVIDNFIDPKYKMEKIYTKKGTIKEIIIKNYD
jgi:DNA adenine methylase